MRIGILTGGGDVPGLNACIKAVVRRADEQGFEVVAFRRGWAGPLNIDPADPASVKAHTIPLSRDAVRTIDRTGGTVLHTSRTDPARLKVEDLPDFLKGSFKPDSVGRVDCTPHILKVLGALKLDALIPIGGDGTLTYAGRLHREGVKTIAIPKTMDNDVFGTDYCIGFSTAVTRSVDCINALRTTTGSHERIAVIELFGRLSGETALLTSYLADADRVLIAECPFDLARVAELIAKDRADNPSRYAMLVVSEGATLNGGHVVESGKSDITGRAKLGGIGSIVGEGVKQLTGIDVIEQSLAYLMRSGPPDSLDRMVATSFGTMAVQLLSIGKSGLMTAIVDGNYAAVPADMPTKGKKRVDVDALYDRQAYRPRISAIEGKPMFLY